MSGTGTHHVPNCYLCGAAGEVLYRGRRDRMFSAPGEWDTRECPQCGLIWLDPQPFPETIPRLYTTYYTHETASSGRETVNKGLRQRARAAVLAVAFGYRKGVSPLGKVLGRLLLLIPAVRDTVGFSVRWLPAKRRGRLLDVGCGAGEFLIEMRSLGWSVAGIEPDPVAAGHARDQYGLTVETGTPETTALPADSFDVVTLNHVIEHLPDPIATLRACRRLLRENGLLVIVTPNTQSLGRRVYGSAWMHWDPPRHLFLFTRDTLSTCVTRAGLTIEGIRTPAQGVRPCWGTSHLIRKHKQLSPGMYTRSLRVHAEETTGLLLESLLVRWGRPAGEEIVVFARVSGEQNKQQ